MNTTPKALLLSLFAAVAVSAQDPKPADAAPAAAPAPAPALAPAPQFSDTQLLEEFGWYVGKRTGLSDMAFTTADSDLVAKGVVEAMNGKDSPFDIQKIGPAITDFIQKKQAAMIETIKNKNKEQASLFFLKLKGDKTVTELPSGLRYTIVTPGAGNPPKPTDTVKVNYTGTLIDGNVFDSSERQGKPVEFQLDKVIPGWTEGLQKIGKGGKIKLYVPPSLGYGDDGRPGIPPGSVLVFDVELVDIPSAPAAAPAGTN
jgi:FKBP-type peptidyl-prolyl cis-trans isomerase